MAQWREFSTIHEDGEVVRQSGWTPVPEREVEAVCRRAMARGVVTAYEGAIFAQERLPDGRGLVIQFAVEA